MQTRFNPPRGKKKPIDNSIDSHYGSRYGRQQLHPTEEMPFTGIEIGVQCLNKPLHTMLLVYSS
jgi:hypothetical protein